jgi:hypothetical protein
VEIDLPDPTHIETRGALPDFRPHLRALAERLVAASEELIFVGGLLLVAVGVSMVYLPAGVILTGLLLCLFSLGRMRRP